MPWTTLNHECAYPTTDVIRKAGAQEGSVWQCECGKEWTLLGRATNGSPLNTYNWEPAADTNTDDHTDGTGNKSTDGKTRTPVTETK